MHKTSWAGSSAAGRTRSEVGGGDVLTEILRFRSGIVLKRILLITGLLGSGFGVFYVARFIAALAAFGSIVGSSNISEDRSTNGRGDQVSASTEASGRWQDPDKTVIRLRPDHHWSWITLVETESFGVREKLNWINDDALDITLGFGCLTHTTPPVETVGSIRISYHLSDGDKALAKGCPD